MNSITVRMFRIIHDADLSLLLKQVLEWLESLDTSFYLYTIPIPILEHLKSKACRSAIMFGEELSLSQCKRLIRELSGCKIPFQCAHGRPSVAPLVQVY
jgi:DNA mismatch repair protein MLH3